MIPALLRPEAAVPRASGNHPASPGSRRGLGSFSPSIPVPSGPTASSPMSACPGSPRRVSGGAAPSPPRHKATGTHARKSFLTPCSWLIRLSPCHILHAPPRILHFFPFRHKKNQPIPLPGNPGVFPLTSPYVRDGIVLLLKRILTGNAKKSLITRTISIFIYGIRLLCLELDQ